MPIQNKEELLRNAKDLGGLRDDAGKTRFDLIPFDALLSVAKVYTQGAEKYAARNWEKGMLWSRCLGSLMRHLVAWETGEDNDAESKLPHMAHVAWNALALLTYHIRGTGSDDRPARPAPESRRATIERLLKEEFDTDAVAFGADAGSSLKEWCNKNSLLENGRLESMDAAYKATLARNQEAAGCMLTAETANNMVNPYKKLRDIKA